MTTLLTDTAATPAAAPSSGTPAAAAAPQQAPATGQPQSDATPAAPAGQPQAEVTGEKPQGAPEKYEFTPHPEGLEFGQEVLTAFSDTARALALPQEAAQKVLDSIAPALAAQSKRHLAGLIQGWIDTTTADKEIGGDALKSNLAIAQKALALGSPELRTLLGPVKDGGTGLGNHPEIIRWALKVGKALSEDTFVAARGGGPNEAKSLAERMYPSAKP